MAHDVFISYSSRDKAVADAVCAAIEGAGWKCWVAPRDIVPGKEWSASIIDAISECRAMVVIFSSHSDASSQVKREVERAVNKNVALVPFRIENVFPTGSMEYYLSTTHWLDALTGPLQVHLEYLAQTLHVLLSASPIEPGHRATALTLTTLAPPPASIAPAPALAPAPLAPRAEWNQTLLTSIENELALHIGPLAKLVIKQALLTVADEAELCRKLSLHLVTPTERAEFLRRCQALTGIRLTEAEPSAQQGSAAPQAEWNEQTLAIAEEQLTQHIGPLAKILVKRAAHETTNLDELYQRLAQHIDSPDERTQFLRCARALPDEPEPAHHSRFSLRSLRRK